MSIRAHFKQGHRECGLPLWERWAISASQGQSIPRVPSPSYLGAHLVSCLNSSSCSCSQKEQGRNTWSLFGGPKSQSRWETFSTMGDPCRSKAHGW